MEQRQVSLHDGDAEDIPTVVITSVVAKTPPTTSNDVMTSLLNFDCFPTIPETSATGPFERRLSEDSRRSSSTSDSSSSYLMSSNASSPRTSLCSASSFHPMPTIQSPCFRRQSSNTLQVPGYAEIGFLHHRNSIESGDRLTLNFLRADFLRRRSLSSLQPQLVQDQAEVDQPGQRRFSAPPPIFHPDMKHRRSSSICRDLKQNFLKLRRPSDMVRSFFNSANLGLFFFKIQLTVNG